MCLTFEECRAKWLRMVERELPQAGGAGGGGRSGGGGGRSATQAFKKKQGAGLGDGGSNLTGAANASGGSAGAGGTRQGGTASGGGGRGGGQTFATPIPRFNGLSVCWGFNRNGCTRPAHSANTCKDANSPSIFAHVCNHWDPVAKTHCYGAHSCREPGRH